MNAFDAVPIAAEPAHADPGGGPYGLKILGTVAAIPVWLAALVACLGAVVDTVARYGFQAPLADLSSLLPEIVSWLLLAALLPGVPYVIWCSVARGTRRWATPLAIAPGAPVSLALIAVSVAYAALSEGVPLAAFWGAAIATLDSFVYLIVVLIAATAALCAGARPPLATASAASFGLLIAVLGMSADISIGFLALGLLVPLVVLGCLYLFGIVGAGMRVVPWLIGIGLSILLALFGAIGVVTPTEAAAIVMFFALVIGLPLRLAFDRHGIAPLLRAAAAEIVAVTLAMIAFACVYFVATLSGWTLQMAAVLKALEPSTALAIVLAVAIVLSALLTPVVGALLAAMTLLAFHDLGFDPVFVAAEILLAALAGMTLRATAWRDPAAATATGKFGPGVGALLLLGYLVVIVGCASLPALVLRLPESLR